MAMRGADPEMMTGAGRNVSLGWSVHATCGFSGPSTSGLARTTYN
jgi:hypothetical protein